MRVRLIKKFAGMIDGVDLRAHDVGEVLSLKRRDARLLIAEQWAVPHRTAARGRPAAHTPTRRPLPARQK